MSRSAHTLSAASGIGVMTLVIAAWTGGVGVSARPSGTIRQTRGVERAAPAAPVDDARQRALHAYASLPVAFVENRGQTDARVRYYASGPRYGFYLTSDEVVLSFMRGAKRHGDRAPSPRPRQTTGAAASRLRCDSSAATRRPGFEGASGRLARSTTSAAAIRARWQTALPRYARDRLSRALAGRRPAAARAGGRPEVRVPRSAGRPARRHPARLPRVGSALALDDGGRAADRDRAWACCAIRRRSRTR